MPRTKPSEQLSGLKSERFLAQPKRLHKSIVGPFLAYHSEHYQALRDVHRLLLKSIETITGQHALFIQSNGTGPATPPTDG
ncbi:hypothetical protein NKI09_23575 [Mesorhizobium sp. M0757]|uniref:hypothetical protein n=1 Tax=Mesorhizobium sp. M0757 TaxID=2956993 RepID=UPI00333D254B